MELHQLRYFVAVAETGSFGRAASRCRISQPTLSQQVIKLEARLGRKLFDRLGRRTVLTESGSALLPRAKAILAEVLEAEREVGGDAEAGRGRIVVGAIPTIAPYLLPGVIRSFLDANPGAEVSVREDVTDSLVEALADAEVDLAVTSAPIDDDRIAIEELMVEPLLVVAPTSAPYADGPTVDLGDLVEQPAIVLNDLHCLGDQMQSLCRSHRVPLRIVCQTAQLATVQSLVSLGLGFSIVPRMCAEADGLDHRVYLPIAPGRAERPIVAAWHPGRLRTRLAERFLDVLRAACRRD